MKYSKTGTWKFKVVNGQLMRECTNCGYQGKKQSIFCPSCQAYMRKD